MSLTSIGTQRTPGRPIEITFAAETGIPSANQEVLLIGQMAAVSGTIPAYTLSVVANSGDITAASGELATKFGQGSQLQNMVLAAIRAVSGLGTVPQLKCIALPFGSIDFGPADAALTAANNVKAEYIVSPFDGTDATLRGKLKDHCLLVSGAQRVENNQFGSFGVVFNRSVQDPSTLPLIDSQYIIPIWNRDTGVNTDAPAYSIAESAAACAARMAANVAPFNPLDSVTITGIAAAKVTSNFITVGAGLESEVCLNKGWTPLFTKPNGEVAFVRTITARISADGSGAPVVGAYYDVQDFNVLYFWRKTLFTRFSQPDFKQRKASDSAATDTKAELIRLARLFESEQMFQAVAQLSKQFLVERNLQDRHRFDYKTPVNVIPGLHVMAGNIEASTAFDVISI